MTKQRREDLKGLLSLVGYLAFMAFVNYFVSSI